MRMYNFFESHLKEHSENDDSCINKKSKEINFKNSFFKTELFKTSILLILFFTVGICFFIYHENENQKYFADYMVSQQTENAATNSMSYFGRHEWILHYLAENEAVQTLTSEGQVSEESQLVRDVVQEMEHIRISIPEQVSNVFLATFPDYQLFDSYGHTFPMGEWVAQRPWWENTNLASDGLALSVVYEDYVTHMKTITLTLPIQQEGELVGIVGLDVDITKLDNMLRDIKIGKTGYITMIDSQGNIIWHPDGNKIGSVVEEWKEKDGESFATQYQEPVNLSFQANGKEYLGTAVYIPKLSVMIVGLISEKEVKENIRSESVGLVSVIAVCVVLFLLASLLNVARIVKPIQRVDRVASMLATGQLGIHIAPRRKDELGRLEYNLGVLADRLSTHNKKLKIERQITEAMRMSTFCNTPEEMITYIVQRMQEIFQADRAYIFELTQQNCWDNTYESVAEGVSQEMDNRRDIPCLELESWESIFEDRKCLISNNIHELQELEPKMYKRLNNQDIHSIAVAPIIHNEVIGFWGLDNPKLENMEQYTSEMVDAGSFVSGMLRQRDLVGKIRQMSFYDEMTGLGNRHLLTEYLIHTNINNSMGVYFADVTGLKRINDTQGHAAGDNLIIRAANAVSSVFREYTVFRYGGDELLVLCKGIEENEMTQRLELIKKVAMESDVTLAIGMSWADNSGDLSYQIMEAESAMYADKDAYYKEKGIERRRF